uniref:Putative secreted protein n=1 Tax=Nyssomyia neivai TaxID=330878 RepID=A0A1L8DNI9_9DIPT
MRIFWAFLAPYVLLNGASVSGIRCYICDSTEHEEHDKCDTHFMDIEECLMDDSELNSTEKEGYIDYVCYRTVYFHNDEGYITMRGCANRSICADLEKESHKLSHREMAIPTECEICDTDLCDPHDSPIEEDNWYNSRCHNLESNDNFCEWEGSDEEEEES